eukprot:scaffold241589_cov19-Tisochrysis_lutea.AAC.1
MAVLVRLGGEWGSAHRPWEFQQRVTFQASELFRSRGGWDVACPFLIETLLRSAHTRNTHNTHMHASFEMHGLGRSCQVGAHAHAQVVQGPVHSQGGHAWWCPDQEVGPQQRCFHSRVSG